MSTPALIADSDLMSWRTDEEEAQRKARWMGWISLAFLVLIMTQAILAIMRMEILSIGFWSAVALCWVPAHRIGRIWIARKLSWEPVFKVNREEASDHVWEQLRQKLKTEGKEYLLFLVNKPHPISDLVEEWPEDLEVMDETD